MNKKSKSQKFSRTHPVSFEWATRCAEFLMLLISLLWTVEAYAREKELSTRSSISTRSSNGAPPVAHTRKNIQNRTPAYARSQSESNMYESNETAVQSQSVKSKRPHLWKQRFHAPISLSSGSTLSDSFKNNPYYSSTQVELLRF